MVGGGTLHFGGKKYGQQEEACPISYLTREGKQNRKQSGYKTSNTTTNNPLPPEAPSPRSSIILRNSTMNLGLQELMKDIAHLKNSRPFSAFKGMVTLSVGTKLNV